MDIRLCNYAKRISELFRLFFLFMSCNRMVQHRKHEEHINSNLIYSQMILCKRRFRSLWILKLLTIRGWLTTIANDSQKNILHASSSSWVPKSCMGYNKTLQTVPYTSRMTSPWQHFNHIPPWIDISLNDCHPSLLRLPEGLS